VTPEPLLQRSTGAESAFNGHRDTDPSASQAPLPAPTNSGAWPALRAPLRNRAVLFELSGAAPGAVFSIHRSGITIGRAETAHIVITGSETSWEHSALTTRSDGIYVEDLRSLNGTFVNDQRIERAVRLAEGDQLRLGGSNTIFKFSMMGEFEENVLRQLFALTLRDSLTHLFNRQYIENQLNGEVALAERRGETLSILAIDIDEFRAINAHFGQRIGDVVMQLIAGTLVKLTRADDVVARLEGGKFAIILHATSARNAGILCERVCHQVAAIALEPTVVGLNLTVSVGLASIGLDGYTESGDELFAHAQEASRSAHASGGNRFWVAVPARPETGRFGNQGNDS